MQVAQSTWQNQLWRECPVDDASLPRLFRDGGRSYPYVKDLFDFAVKGCGQDEVIVFTNSDICVRSNASSIIAAELQDRTALYSFRRDFAILKEPLPDAQIATGHPYAGTDLKAFRASWWKKYRDSMPDMLLGNEAWDSVMRVLIEKTHQGQNLGVDNLIYHEKHPSRWENPKQRYALPSQLHNLRLAYPWFKKQGYRPEQFGVRKV
jgi:hypothetical protein